MISELLAEVGYVNLSVLSWCLVFWHANANIL